MDKEKLIEIIMEYSSLSQEIGFYQAKLDFDKVDNLSIKRDEILKKMVDEISKK